jgi:hypothetical protein
MRIVWGSFWQRSRKWLKTGWLITAGVVAIYVGAIEPQQNAREIRSQRANGLGAVNWEPTSFWRQTTWHDTLALRHETAMPKFAAMNYAVGVSSADAPDRKITRNSALELIVKSPAQTSESIRVLAERLGGYLESSQLNGSQDAPSATIIIRVPASRFEEARAEIRKLGLRVENERTDGKDVTKEYVDLEARLRNLRAEEAQYLAIMKNAHTVKDTLEVSEKLSQVRGNIEQQQAEFDALSKQVETVAITVSLRAEAEAQVFGLHWRPLYQIKLAARQGLDSVGDYAASMASFLFYLPTVLLWLGTILIAAALGWRILRWAARVLFAFPKVATVEAGR